MPTRYIPDKWILLSAGFLLFFGCLIMLSSSSYISFKTTQWSYSIFTEHLLRIGAGLLIGGMIFFIPIEILRKLNRLLFFFLILSLIFLLFEGHFVQGARRWFRLFDYSFQPAELMKFSLLLHLADFLERKRKWKDSFLYGTIAPFAQISVVALLIALQPNLSMAILIFLLGLLLLFSAGIRFFHLLFVFSVGALLVLTLLFFSHHSKRRLLTFMQGQEPYQVLQAKIGISSGQITGVGPGLSREKFAYLPFAHTDFVFAIVAEEYGYIGASAVLFAVFVLVFRGLRTARILGTQTFAGLVSAGISLMFALFALLHSSVSVNLIPPTGQPFPFMSFGGSAMLANLCALAILLRFAGFANWQEERWGEKKTIIAQKHTLAWGKG